MGAKPKRPKLFRMVVGYNPCGLPRRSPRMNKIKMIGGAASLASLFFMGHLRLVHAGNRGAETEPCTKYDATLEGSSDKVAVCIYASRKQGGNFKFSKISYKGPAGEGILSRGDLDLEHYDITRLDESSFVLFSWGGPFYSDSDPRRPPVHYFDMKNVDGSNDAITIIHNLFVAKKKKDAAQRKERVRAALEVLTTTEIPPIASGA